MAPKLRRQKGLELYANERGSSSRSLVAEQVLGFPSSRCGACDDAGEWRLMRTVHNLLKLSGHAQTAMTE